MELALFRVLHHLLEIGPPVCLTRDGPVCIDLADRDAELRSIGLGFSHLLLNACVLLGVAAIPGINDAALAAVQRLPLLGLRRFFRHRHPLYFYW